VRYTGVSVPVDAGFMHFLAYIAIGVGVVWFVFKVLQGVGENRALLEQKANLERQIEENERRLAELEKEERESLAAASAAETSRRSDSLM
jgi:hypothetical protein